MAATDYIEPFPDSIDRDAFGHYISGFTDGEGHFGLTMMMCNNKKWTPKTHFAIALRADDIEILKLIRSYFGCGNLFPIKHKRPAGTQPAVMYACNRDKDLYFTIVPHFDKYPLHAKKKRDYAIWREAVCFAHEVRQLRTPGRRGEGRWGVRPRWTEERAMYFQSLADSLKQLRLYDTTVPAIPRIRPTLPRSQEEKSLFQDLEPEP